MVKMPHGPEPKCYCDGDPANELRCYSFTRPLLIRERARVKLLQGTVRRLRRMVWVLLAACAAQWLVFLL